MPISAHEDNVSHGLIKYIWEGLPIAVVLLIMQLNDKQTPSCADIFFGRSSCIYQYTCMLTYGEAGSTVMQPEWDGVLAHDLYESTFGPRICTH